MKNKQMKQRTLRFLAATAAVLCGAGSIASAQLKVGNNPTVLNASAALEIESTNKGFLPPRVQLTGLDDVTTIASPADGLIVYNKLAAGSGTNAIQAGALYMFSNGKWGQIVSNNTTQSSVIYGANTITPIPTSNIPAGTTYSFQNIRIRYTGSVGSGFEITLNNVTSAFTTWSELTGQGHSGSTSTAHRTYENVAPGSWKNLGITFATDSRRDTARVLMMIHSTREVYRISIVCNPVLTAPLTDSALVYYVEKLQ